MHSFITKNIFVATKFYFPHHCGNHGLCTVAHYKNKSIELAEKIVHDLSIENDEIPCEVQIKINERHSNISRFKGISMNISAEG